MKIIVFLFIIWMCWASMAMASWDGPIDVLNLGWGDQIGQVAITHTDMGDTFATLIQVDNEGNILIPDGGNQRLLIYSSAGSLMNLIKPLKYVPYLLENKRILIKARGNYIIYDYSGKQLNKFNGVVFARDVYTKDNKIIVYAWKEKKYYVYSPTGQLLKTYTERPLELGEVEEQSLGGGRYKVTIKYPDMTYTLKQRAIQ